MRFRLLHSVSITVYTLTYRPCAVTDTSVLTQSQTALLCVKQTCMQPCTRMAWVTTYMPNCYTFQSLLISP